eukprot:GDKJ01032759.1.p1 GENE.GDKJ01032759.1~~GDKJ01032759.1.p1  ORF type:complete len:808 (+),score=110.63 GDKJ01032759.1:291-2714(+)
MIIGFLLFSIFIQEWLTNVVQSYDISAVSKFQRCVDQEIECDDTLIITMTITGDYNSGNSTYVRINRATSSSDPVTIEPIYIYPSKSAVKAKYSLSYVRSATFQPRELQRLVVTHLTDRTTPTKQFVRTALGIFSFAYYFSSVSDYIYSNAICGPPATTSNQPAPAYYQFVCPPQEIVTEGLSSLPPGYSLSTGTTSDGVTYILGSDGYCCNCQAFSNKFEGSEKTGAAKGSFRNEDMSCSDSNLAEDSCHSLLLYNSLLSTQTYKTTLKADASLDSNALKQRLISSPIQPLERSDIFSIQDPAWVYTMNFKISFLSNVQKVWKEEQLTISPSLPSSSSEVATLKHLGDYQGVSSLPYISGLFLVTKQTPNWQYHAIFVDKSAVGAECNQIGVSYTAFQNHMRNSANCVAASKKSCLNNQHADYLAEDEDRITKSLQPLYKISPQTESSKNSGGVLGAKSFILDPLSAQGSYLLHDYGGTHTSRVSIEMKGDSVTQVVSPSVGSIIGASLAGDIRVGGGMSFISVLVENTGGGYASFLVQSGQICKYSKGDSSSPAGDALPVLGAGTTILRGLVQSEGGGSCSVGQGDKIKGGASSSKSVPGGASSEFSIPVRIGLVSNESEFEGAVWFAEVSLKDASTGGVLDTAFVRITTQKSIQEKGQQGGEGNKGKDVVVVKIPKLEGASGRAESQGGFGNFMLGLVKSWLFWVMFLVGAILLGVILYFFGCCSKVVLCFSKCFGLKKRQKKSQTEEESLLKKAKRDRNIVLEVKNIKKPESRKKQKSRKKNDEDQDKKRQKKKKDEKTIIAE